MATATTVRMEDAAAVNDCEVVRRFMAGDERAFDELVRRYQRRLLGFVVRMLEDQEQSEDVVQEAFVRVFRNIHRFDQSKKFSTWIYAIARNLARNELRKRSRCREVTFRTLAGDDDQGRPLEWADPEPGPDELFRRRGLRGRVEEAVALLPERHRVVFVLRELEGRSYGEIAAISGCKVGTVKSRLNRAREHFAQVVAPMID